MGAFVLTPSAELSAAQDTSFYLAFFFTASVLPPEMFHKGGHLGPLKILG